MIGLDSPILLMWTSRLKETLLSAGFHLEAEASCSELDFSDGWQASPSIADLRESER